MMIDSTQHLSDQYYITSFCKINNTGLKSSNASANENNNFSDFNDFSKFLYNKFELNYPKFYKMDNLSKLAVLTSEVLLKNIDLNFHSPETIGVVIGNSFATLDTDNNYYQTILDKNNYFPSPSLFVYTLPNIMIGEICIRHKIMGENAFFVFNEFNHNFISKYVKDLLDTEKIKCCITGWVDFTQSSFESLLFFVEAGKKEENALPYNKDISKILYSA